MDVRNLNAQELEEFLYDYTISLDSLDEIIEPYNDLIARASADHEKYYQRKINDFEEWKQYEKNQNLYNLENNEIYDLEKNVIVHKSSLPYYLVFSALLLAFF